MAVIISLLALSLVNLGASQTQRSHLTISSAETQGKRVYAVGDVHGCYYELIDLLQLIGCVDTSDNVLDDCIVVLAGDTVNKGPYSLEVLRWIETNWGKAYAAAGNHEGNALNDWGVEEWTIEATDEDKAFLESLPWSVTLESFGTVVVHAGLIPNMPTTDQEEFVMTRMRNLERDGDSYIPYEEPTEGGDNWAQVYSADQTSELRFVIYGHDAGRGDNGVQEFGLTRGIETRCSKGGVMTALKLPIYDNAYANVPCACYDC